MLNKKIIAESKINIFKLMDDKTQNLFDKCIDLIREELITNVSKLKKNKMIILKFQLPNPINTNVEIILNDESSNNILKDIAHFDFNSNNIKIQTNIFDNDFEDLLFTYVHELTHCFRYRLNLKLNRNRYFSGSDQLGKNLIFMYIMDKDEVIANANTLMTYYKKGYSFNDVYQKGDRYFQIFLECVDEKLTNYELLTIKKELIKIFTKGSDNDVKLLIDKIGGYDSSLRMVNMNFLNTHGYLKIIDLVIRTLTRRIGAIRKYLLYIY